MEKLESIRQLAKEHNLKPSMVFGRLKKGWSLQEAMKPKGWKRPKDIQKMISIYDDKLIYISGYENKNSKVKLYCKRCGKTFERTYDRLSQKKREGKLCCENCQRQVAKRTIRTIKDTTKERELQFIERLNKQYPTLEYVGGYKHSDKGILLRCKICGDVFKRTAQCVRSGRNTTCFNCTNIEKENKRKQELQQKIATDMIRQQARHINDIKLNKNKEIERIYKKFKKNTLYVQKCVVCNEEYIGRSQSKYCPMCRKKVSHHHSYKSLKRLYDRDNGICHICNELCDWNDKRIDKGTIIVGSNYPSIDHIIPLAKGGTDDWNNLGLAHVRCNLIKKDN